MENEIIKPCSSGSLWAPIVYDAPETVTIPADCATNQRLQKGQFYIAIGEGDQYHFVRKLSSLKEDEKAILKIMKPTLF
ncbi:hypothetical protein ANCCAN_26283 [Ancylostoma caninum]|uniref:Uncharacterized protein n=1 Tax=Ancylostoma caninum TaxID=29170 RepID=A0A368FAG2_ANCCA|nr:hypothetical protein ANCCAN_26283 [Ancylostoma caninum]